MPKTKPILRPSPLTWSNSAGRYRDERTGRFVARSVVAEARLAVVEDAQKQMRAISQAYVDGKITLIDWQLSMRDAIKAGHIVAAGISLGGKKNMTAQHWGWLGSQLKAQYAALNRFALQLEQGGKINLGRVDMYARAIRATSLNAERLRQNPLAKARWVRTAKESCAGCIEQSGRGVQPLAMFPPIGSQNCLSNCRCLIEIVNG